MKANMKQMFLFVTSNVTCWGFLQWFSRSPDSLLHLSLSFIWSLTHQAWFSVPLADAPSDDLVFVVPRLAVKESVNKAFRLWGPEDITSGIRPVNSELASFTALVMERKNKQNQKNRQASWLGKNPHLTRTDRDKLMLVKYTNTNIWNKRTGSFLFLWNWFDLLLEVCMFPMGCLLPPTVSEHACESN